MSLHPRPRTATSPQIPHSGHVASPRNSPHPRPSAMSNASKATSLSPSPSPSLSLLSSSSSAAAATTKPTATKKATSIPTSSTSSPSQISHFSPPHLSITQATLGPKHSPTLSSATTSTSSHTPSTRPLSAKKSHADKQSFSMTPHGTNSRPMRHPSPSLQNSSLQNSSLHAHRPTDPPTARRLSSASSASSTPSTVNPSTVDLQHLSDRQMRIREGATETKPPATTSEVNKTQKPTKISTMPKSTSHDSQLSSQSQFSGTSLRSSGKIESAQNRGYKPRWASSGMQSFEPVLADEIVDMNEMMAPSDRWAFPSAAVPTNPYGEHSSPRKQTAPIVDQETVQEARMFLQNAQEFMEDSDHVVLTITREDSDRLTRNRGLLPQNESKRPISRQGSRPSAVLGAGEPYERYLDSQSAKEQVAVFHKQIRDGNDGYQDLLTDNTRPCKKGDRSLKTTESMRRSLVERLNAKIEQDAATTIQTWFRRLASKRKAYRANEGLGHQGKRKEIPSPIKTGSSVDFALGSKDQSKRMDTNQMRMMKLQEDLNSIKKVTEQKIADLKSPQKPRQESKFARPLDSIEVNGIPRDFLRSSSLPQRKLAWDRKYSETMATCIIQRTFRKFLQRRRSREVLVRTKHDYGGQLTPFTDKQDKDPRKKKLSPSEDGRRLLSSDVESCRSGDRVSELMSFLDHVEAESGRPNLPTNKGDIQALQLRIIDLEVELKEQKKVAQGLNVALKKQREKEHEAIMNASKQEKEKIAILKEESEAVISRHLAFIDQLLGDKQELSRQCEDLANELKSIDSRYTAKIQDLEEHFKKELKKQKDAWTVSEKSKREQLLAEKTKEIKESTIKGLEPEIQRLLAKHKQDLKRQEEKHQEEMKKALREAKELHEKENGLIKDRLGRDKEEALERERELSRQRLRELAERDEIQINDLRRRITADLNTERDHFEKEKRLEKQRFDDTLLSMKKAEEERVSSLMRSHREQIQTLETKHQDYITKLKEEWKIEKESWQSMMMVKIDAELKAKEEVLRKQLSRERDVEIEKVLLKLDEDSSSERASLVRDYEKKLQDTTQSFAARQKQLEDSERSCQERAVKLAKELELANTRCSSMEDQLRELKSVLSTKGDYANQLIADLEKVKTMSEKKESDLVEHHQRQLQMRVDLINQLEKNLKHEKDERTRLEQSQLHDLEQVRQKHEEELDRLNERIRKTIQKKDEQIGQLQLQLQQSEARLQKTEMLLEKKRYDLF